MRVDLLVHAYPPDSLGGTELYTQRLAEGLLARGHRVRVLTYALGHRPADQPRDAEVSASADSTSEGVGAPSVQRLVFSLEDSANPLRDEYDNARVGRYLSRLWGSERPDVVHMTHCGYLSSVALKVASELGIPTLVTLTDLWALCPLGTLLRHDGALCDGPRRVGQCLRCVAHMGPRGERYARQADAAPVWAIDAAARLSEWPLLRRAPYAAWLSALRQRPVVIRKRMLAAGALLSPSRFQIDVLARNGYPRPALRWLPHGIPDPETLRSPARGQPDDALRLGYIGPLAAHKGAHLPVEAFARLGPASGMTLSYWGPLPDPGARYGSELLRRIDAAAGITHRGAFAPAHVGRVLEQMDVLIVPSLCYENTPTIIYEALAHGTPVLGSDQGGVRELVELYDGGWLFPRGDADALAARLRALAADPAGVRRAAARIRPVPDMAGHVDAVAALYEQVTHGC